MIHEINDLVRKLRSAKDEIGMGKDFEEKWMKKVGMQLKKEIKEELEELRKELRELRKEVEDLRKLLEEERKRRHQSSKTGTGEKEKRSRQAF